MRRRDALPLACAPLFAQEKNLRVVVRMEMAAGEILVALSGDRAPKTVANFLRYLDAGLYDGGVFHRSVKKDNQPQSPVKIEVIQGGPNPEKKTSYEPIELERTTLTGLKHVHGAISMARSGPNTATGDFFLCIGDQPELDFGGKRNPDGQGFAAFGMVLKGLDVIKRIQQAPVVGQKLVPPIAILKMVRV